VDEKYSGQWVRRERKKCGDVLRKNANTKHATKLNHYKQMNLIHGPWAFNFLYDWARGLVCEGEMFVQTCAPFDF
jgi:hypothetical protein